MKGLIKLLLLVVVIVYSLYDYRLLSFQKGFSQMDFENDNFVESVKLLTSIKKIEYYKRTFYGDDKAYMVYVETKEKVYLKEATKDEVDGLNLVGVLFGEAKPQEIMPISIWVKIIVAGVILIIPTGSRRRKSKSED